MKIKRIIAYIIDYFIVNMIALLLFTNLPMFKENYNNFMKVSEEYMETVSTIGSGEIDEDYILQYSYETTRETIPLTIITCGLMITYLGIIAYLCNGQTLGKKIMKIKIVPTTGNKLNPNLFMIRAIIITNIIPTLTEVICTMYLSQSNWLIAYNVTSYISELVIFLILGFMIFREDEKGLHDLLCKTNVIEVQKK